MTAATFEEVHAEFVGIVETMPAGHAYERLTSSGRALYVHGWPAGPPEPGCIVAHWLHRCRGVPLEALVTLETISGPSVVLQLMATNVLPFDLLNDSSSAQVLKYLQTVQGGQDKGWAWRGAVEAAYVVVTTPPWSVLLAPSWELPPRLQVDA